MAHAAAGRVDAADHGHAPGFAPGAGDGFAAKSRHARAPGSVGLASTRTGVMLRDLRRDLPGIAGFVLLGGVSDAMAQGDQVDLTVDAGPSLHSLAERVRRIDRPHLAAALARSGFNVPPQVRVTRASEIPSRSRHSRSVHGRDILAASSRSGAPPMGVIGQ